MKAVPNINSIFFWFGLNPNGKLRKRSFDTFNEPIFNKDSFSEMLERMNKTHNRYVNMKSALIGEEKYDSGLAQASDYFPGAMKEIFSNPKSGHEKTSGGNFLSENGRTIGQRRKEIIEKSFGANYIEEEQEESNDVLEVTEEDQKPKFKGKGKGKNRMKIKPDKISIDLSQDLKSLCKSLAAVREDPSLLSGINDDDVLLPKKRKTTGIGKRGRPSKKSSNNEDDPLAISPKIRIKKKKKKIKKKPEASIFDI